MFSFFESRIRPTELPPSAPPPGLIAFYWHFIRQTQGLYAAMFLTGLGVALIDTLIPVVLEGSPLDDMRSAEQPEVQVSPDPSLAKA